MKQRRTLGIKLKQINNLYEKELNQILKRLGITSSQSAVLEFLYNTDADEVNQIDIERALSLRNPTVTGILKRMEAAGFLFTVPNSTDKRKKNIFLTEKAFDIQKKIELQRRKIEKHLTLGMSKREADALERQIDKVLYNMEEP